MTQTSGPDFVCKMIDPVSGEVSYHIIPGGTGYTLAQAQDRAQRWATSWATQVVEVGPLSQPVPA
jgi:hypothetical protein